MPYEMSWYYPNRVIYAHCYGEFIAEDLKNAGAEYYAMIQDGELLVHSIFDIRDTTHLPGLREARSTMTYDMSAREGWMVVIGGNPAFRFIASVLLQLFKYRFRLVPTFEDAIAFIQKNDDTLPPLPNQQPTGKASISRPAASDSAASVI